VLASTSDDFAGAKMNTVLTIIRPGVMSPSKPLTWKAIAAPHATVNHSQNNGRQHTRKTAVNASAQFAVFECQVHSPSRTPVIRDQKQCKAESIRSNCRHPSGGRRKIGAMPVRRHNSEFFISRRGFLRHDGGMGKRREARERAVQFLFQHDLNPPDNLEQELDQFWNTQRAAAIEEEKSASKWGEPPAELPPPTAEEAETRLFADPLIRGVIEHRDEIDERIKQHCQNWDFHRIAAVDRNVMRLAIFEMLHREDIPPVVSINEAVDIAKKFSTEDSGKFVNGILDKVRSEILRPARDVQ